MQINESPTPLELSSDGGVKTSPFHPTNLFNLFFRPRRFFEQIHTIESKPYIYICAWIYGIAVIDSFRLPSPIVNEEQLFALENLLLYLLTYLVVGAVGGLLEWWIGTWWYKVRLRWSGEPSPNGIIARQIYFYSGLVLAIPMILLTFFLFTVIYFSSGDINEPLAKNLGTLFFYAKRGFLFWSLIISFNGVWLLFKLKIGETFLWFVALPSIPSFISLCSAISQSPPLPFTIAMLHLFHS